MRAVAVEAEDREALMGVAADPDQAAAELGERQPLGEAPGLGAFGDHRHIGPQAQQRLEFAMQRHGAIPGDEAHQLSLA